MKSSLETCEQKVLRKIYSPIKGHNGSKIITNNELQVTYRNPNTVTTIKVRRLEWAGHPVRLSDYRTVKKYFWGNQTEEEKQEDQN
jgi:hypothetical protein